MASRLYTILQGSPAAASSTLQLLPTGLGGTQGALRRLVHPDTTNFPAVVYYTNPTREVNFDAEVQLTPIVQVIRTLTGSRVIRFDELEEDVVVQEIWEPAGGLSMPVFFYRQLKELAINQPAFSSTSQQFTVWEPRDRTADTWRVQVLDCFCPSFKHYRDRGGPNDANVPGTILTPSDTTDANGPTAFLDQTVTLTMRIVEKVT